MTDPRIRIDRTVLVSREEYDRMADQRDEFRKLAYGLKAQLGYARASLLEARRLVDRMPNPPTGVDEDDWFELTQGLAAAEGEARAYLDECPKLTG